MLSPPAIFKPLLRSKQLNRATNTCCKAVALNVAGCFANGNVAKKVSELVFLPPPFYGARAGSEVHFEPREGLHRKARRQEPLLARTCSILELRQFKLPESYERNPARPIPQPGQAHTNNEQKKEERSITSFFPLVSGKSPFV